MVVAKEPGLPMPLEVTQPLFSPEAAGRLQDFMANVVSKGIKEMRGDVESVGGVLEQYKEVKAGKRDKREMPGIVALLREAHDLRREDFSEAALTLRTHACRLAEGSKEGISSLAVAGTVWGECEDHNRIYEASKELFDVETEPLQADIASAQEVLTKIDAFRDSPDEGDNQIYASIKAQLVERQKKLKLKDAIRVIGLPTPPPREFVERAVTATQILQASGAIGEPEVNALAKKYADVFPAQGIPSWKSETSAA